jgi:two-component system chemotaxis response regulator CheY
MKILIVDDSLMDRKIIAATLKKGGVEHEILEAQNGEEGLQTLVKNRGEIGLILLDWQMPVMDGIEFMEGVVKVPAVASIPIVMISASGSEENKKQARTVNPNLAGYVVKPYKPAELMNAVGPFLKKSQ